MGIYNRDYIRDQRAGGGGFGGNPVVCKRLIIITIVVFVLQLLITRAPNIELPPGVSPEDLPTNMFRVSVVQQWLELDPEKTVYQGQVWRLITCAFCHDRYKPFHIIFNMLFLWWFGRTLEAMYGSREFLLLYLTAALISSLAFIAFALFMHDPAPAIGASGAVMAVVMLYAIHYPREQILIFFIIPVEIRWIVVCFVIFDLYPILLALGGDAAAVSDGVAHAAHLGGVAFGYIYYRWNLRLERWLDYAKGMRWKPRSRARREFRVYHPAEENIDDRVDEILAKIHNEGEASLSDDERRILKEASRRYQQKQ